MNAVADHSLWTWLSSLDSDERVALTLAGMIGIVLVVLILAFTAYAIHKNRLDDAFRRELLDRGLSADEIATITRRPPASSPFACGNKRASRNPFRWSKSEA